MLLLAILPATFLPAAAQAQVPDSKGNYYRNDASVLAPNRFNKLVPGFLWRVMVDELNCRQDASLDSPVNRTFQVGDLLEVEVYRGGSDEVYVNPLDRNGRPWMPVRGANTEDKCYVRANSRFIQPVTVR